MIAFEMTSPAAILILLSRQTSNLSLVNNASFSFGARICVSSWTCLKTLNKNLKCLKNRFDLWPRQTTSKNFRSSGFKNSCEAFTRTSAATGVHHPNSPVFKNLEKLNFNPREKSKPFYFVAFWICLQPRVPMRNRANDILRLAL